MSLESKNTLLTHLEIALEDVLTVSALRKTISIISKELIDYNVTLVEESTKTNCVSENDYALLTTFLEAKKLEGCSEKTLWYYRYNLLRMLKAVNIKITDITIQDLRWYLSKLAENGNCDKTIESNRSIISSFFMWLYRENLIVYNPCINLNPIKCAKKIKFPFTSIEIEKLNEVCTTLRDRALIHFLLSTGCRIGEVCKLNRNDINFSTLECTVLGKGNKERTVFINDITAMLLQRYLDTRTDTLQALFIGKGSDRMTPGGVRFRLNTLAKEAGVEHVHPHRFRRTLATNLINRGMTVQEVAHILGHENINTTMAYVYIDKNNVKSAYKKFV